MPTLRVASVDERQETIRNNHVEWGKPLSLDEYFYREQTLSVNCFGQLKTWVYVDNDSNEIIAQCETYERKVRVVTKNDVTEGSGFGVASVFVLPKYRGKGFGSSMMKDLLKKMNGLISHLYSDVGPNFYSRLGWEVYGPYMLQVAVAEYQSQPSNVEAFSLAESDLACVVSSYDDHLMSMAFSLVNSTPEVTRVSVIVPTVETVIWFRKRAEVFARFLPAFQHVDMKSRPFGVKVGPDYFTYFHDFKSNVLFVLFHCVSSSENARALLNHAIHEAKQCNLKTIEIWNPSRNLLNDSNFDIREFEKYSKGWEKHVLTKSAITGAKLLPRTEESIPSLIHLPPAQEFSRDYWVGNEKYCWI